MAGVGMAAGTVAAGAVVVGVGVEAVGVGAAVAGAGRLLGGVGAGVGPGGAGVLAGAGVLVGVGAQAGFGSQDGAGFGARICLCFQHATGVANNRSRTLGSRNVLVENDMSVHFKITKASSASGPGTAWG